ncbi:chemerin-like receptor 2 isoform X2 [Ahaetulla prasina]|nr:chemerin-like receptor 2 isoform X2 [Ahaetulla prasina]XP_058042552.1 chemerin-like receptor 2 isoform X2 [Ahaetulla prasina]XP_058042560.1 chemerin-like receptor 2 isoform X2 [Ahaetulla prasina]XP_058042564.1 chemerin-like receptor 2 isoform X2 [Ahaetulla prasina]XP_058042573.1 chemerin-like receptor 2 isoform X2 [Ahaetulla prasina]XP_058042582.1 chemerin-like receptor 2 isoform X2 [Ahaetulla prasina]XP_058042591.1 chemerin-like receptor 2 isoform X2 [Ahaetulla prasina]
MSSADFLYQDNFTEYFEDYEEDEPLQAQAYLSHARIASLVLQMMAFLLGVPGNAIVIWIMGFKWNKTVTSIWFLNLAIADLIFVLFLPLYIAYIIMGFHWPFGKWLCKANAFIALLNMFASVFFLTAISIDRYVHLIHPAFSYRHRTLGNACILVLLIWILATVLGSPALYFKDTLILPQNVTICYYNFHHNLDIILFRHHTLTWIKFICGYLFPLLTMIVCYSFLVSQVKKSTVLTSSRLFWTILAVVVVFFICWTPYQIFSILELAAHHNISLHDLLENAMPLSIGLAFINSCLNPILYVLLSKKLSSCFSVTFSELVKHTLWEVSRSATVSDHGQNSLSLQLTEVPVIEHPLEEILQ